MSENQIVPTKKKNTPNILDPDYLIREFFELMENNPKSAPQLFENLINFDYDFDSLEGVYRLLNEDQRALLKRIHERRKQDPKFDEWFQYHLVIIAGGVLLGKGLIELGKYINRELNN